MRRTKREHRTDIAQSLRGIGFVVLCIVSLLVVMELVIIFIRFFAA